MQRHRKAWGSMEQWAGKPMSTPTSAHTGPRTVPRATPTSSSSLPFRFGSLTPLYKNLSQAIEFLPSPRWMLTHKCHVQFHYTVQFKNSELIISQEDEKEQSEKHCKILFSEGKSTAGLRKGQKKKPHTVENFLRKGYCSLLADHINTILITSPFLRWGN